MYQSLTISDANALEKLIDEMKSYLGLLRIEQEKIEEEVNEKVVEEIKKKEEEVKKKFEEEKKNFEDDEGILKIPHFETMEERKKRNEETSIFDDDT